MPAAPWRGAALLLCCACLCAALGKLTPAVCSRCGSHRPTSLVSVCFSFCTEQRGCILGEVGKPVLLPCHPNLGRLSNFSVEWRNHDEAVFRSLWDGDGNVETWSVNYARIPTDAAATGNFSLELPSPSFQTYPNLFTCAYSKRSQNHLKSLTFVSFVVVAASFRIPEVRKEESSYLCRSWGGYPQPVVYWLIDDSRQPPDGAVTTRAQALPDSHLYNVTSRLTVNVSKDDTVSSQITFKWFRRKNEKKRK
uniref:CD80-like immunoglobulin C2-set domain-containing protein n=1 Tax=Xiphophorus maculatus TaxID=8083 RepID=A0A3B5QLX4_XIPMA